MANRYGLDALMPKARKRPQISEATPTQGASPPSRRRARRSPTDPEEGVAPSGGINSTPPELAALTVTAGAGLGSTGPMPYLHFEGAPGRSKAAHFGTPQAAASYLPWEIRRGHIGP
ncbi:MAG: hypothetical protein ACYDGN_11365 [Acidimicrobiales bacterium]